MTFLATPRRNPLLAVRAQAAPKAAIDDIVSAFEAFKSHYSARLDALEDDEGRRSAAAKLNGNSSDGLVADPKYRADFSSYARFGGAEVEAALRIANEQSTERGIIKAAMSEGVPSSGGYVAPVEWDRQIRQSLRALSPLRLIARTVTTAVNGYSTLWNDGQWGSGWVGETASRPQTSTATLKPLDFPAGEIYAMPAATQRLIDDSAIDFEKWIADELSAEFARQEGIAFVSGDGANKPLGFLQYLPGGVAAIGQAKEHPGGELGVTPSGSAAALTADGLVDLKYGLGAPYRQGAVWLMNSGTAALVAKMKDGDGNFIWRESLAAGEPATLLGSPVMIDENMPSVAANAFAIAYGDFSQGYLINDRRGIVMLRDPFTAKPYVLFYVTRRVGGGVLDPKAIRVQKIAAS